LKVAQSPFDKADPERQRRWRLRKKDSTRQSYETTEERLFDNWFDPADATLRAKVHSFIEMQIEEDQAVAVARYTGARSRRCANGA
jgi:hypothetical protein